MIKIHISYDNSGTYKYTVQAKTYEEALRLTLDLLPTKAITSIDVSNGGI